MIARRLRAALFVLVGVTAGVLQPAHGANLSVPSMLMYTRGYMNQGTFVLSSFGSMDLLVEGGYKFGAQATFGFESDSLENDTAVEQVLTFKLAKVVIRDIFGLPVDFAYFSGENATFASGDAFPQRFGATPFATDFRGYRYFPEGIRYDGIHTVDGTGGEISTMPTDWLFAALYAYQDAYIGAGYYSGDLRGMLSFPRVKLEAFVGGTYPSATYGVYRGGLLFYYDTGSGGEFLTQIGIPRWDPMTAFGIDLFYFLFEPRVHVDPLTIFVTLFWHPEYYLQQATNELGSVDINVKFLFGDRTVHTATGGVETTFAVRTTQAEQFSAKVSPFVSIVTAGVLWDIKVNVNLFPFDLNNIAEGIIGIRAEL
jgi:hypothetical protein